MTETRHKPEVCTTCTGLGITGADPNAPMLELAALTVREDAKDIQSFLSRLPRHEASLHLTHNQHLAYYHTVAQEDDDATERGQSWFWVSEAQRQKARETNDVWELHWYPDTPIGSFCIYAADLNALLTYVEAQTWRD